MAKISGLENIEISEHQIQEYWDNRVNYNISDQTYSEPLYKVVCACQVPPPPVYLTQELPSLSKLTTISHDTEVITIFDFKQCNIVLPECD